MTLMEWLAPWLIPLRQISGFRCKTLSTASFTQSTGVPEHCQASTPSKMVTGWRRRGNPMVMAWPMPDWGLSGATTTTLPRSLTASTRLSIPGAMIPSSLVIRMTGKFFFFDLDIVIKGLQKYYFFPDCREKPGRCATFAAGLKYPYGRTTEGSSKPDQIHPEHPANHEGDENDQRHQTAQGSRSYSADAAIFQKTTTGTWQY